MPTDLKKTHARYRQEDQQEYVGVEKHAFICL